MNKDQWTVLGLLVVLASLEIIRSGAVQSFFGGFFSRFSVGSNSTSSSASSSVPGPSGQSVGPTYPKGMPTNTGAPTVRGPF